LFANCLEEGGGDWAVNRTAKQRFVFVPLVKQAYCVHCTHAHARARTALSLPPLALTPLTYNKQAAGLEAIVKGCGGAQQA
jgi:hypothetical protein